VVCFTKLYTYQSFTTVLPYLQILVQDSMRANHDGEDVEAVAQARQLRASIYVAKAIRSCCTSTPHWRRRNGPTRVALARAKEPGDRTNLAEAAAKGRATNAAQADEFAAQLCL
jgi:hypothetical protein